MARPGPRSRARSRPTRSSVISSRAPRGTWPWSRDPRGNCGTRRMGWHGSPPTRWPTSMVSIGAGDEGFVRPPRCRCSRSRSSLTGRIGSRPRPHRRPRLGQPVYVALSLPAIGTPWNRVMTGVRVRRRPRPSGLSANGSGLGGVRIDAPRRDRGRSDHHLPRIRDGPPRLRAMAGGRIPASRIPCSEGGFVVHGTQRGSTDGTTWTDLPFPAGTVGETGFRIGHLCHRHGEWPAHPRRAVEQRRDVLDRSASVSGR